MEGRTTLIPILFRLGHPEVTLRDYCRIVSPWCSNTSILDLFTRVALESSPKYRVIFILYLRRLAHTYRDEREGRGAADGMSLLADGLQDQYNTIVFSSLRDSERHGGTYGVIASDEVFIRLYWRIHFSTLSHVCALLFRPPLSH